MSKNLASKYSKQVSERFTRESQASMAVNNDYEFTGVKTVNVYSIPTVPMTDYTRSGNNRYGEANDLTRNVQTMTVDRDRAFTFIIDKGDKVQSQMVMEAGKALSRQQDEVWVPEYDAYVFRTMAYAASSRGNIDTTNATKANAYELFLNAMEHMSNRNVPDKGRVAFCSYRFANLLKLDPAFTKTSDASQDMLKKGVMGEVDGCRIVKVPSSRLPAGCAFILAHPSIAVAPKQLEEYKIHDNPPGISGWLVEGRVIYDCFVLDEKADALFYLGKQEVLKYIDVLTAVSNTANDQTIVLINTEAETGHSFVYKAYASSSAAPTVTAGDDLSSWTAVKSGDAVAPGADMSMIMVAEVDGEKKAVGTGTAKIHMA